MLRAALRPAIRSSVNLRGLGTGDKKWHVHELPAPINGDGTGPGCMRTEAHFNPTFGLGALEDGDLSHILRHGPFGEDAVREFYQDPPLESEDGKVAGITLHGNNSVVGRSIVIHKPNGERWGCANIGPAGMGYTVVFPAREDKQYPVGTVQFFQAHEQALTTITVRLANMPAAPGGGLELRTMSVPAAPASSQVK